ncbi:MAG: gluconate 2-dehydrogenase subunit 3 family protein [Saprospiraceae bacterium]|nr:gluconate 2-dehydrogenase subunit 3 family protein [Saprospiraceae bacterium]
MDRRETLKSLLIGTMAGSVVIQGCRPAEQQPEDQKVQSDGYGRLPKELQRDKELMDQTFFSVHELATIAVICDIILPADDGSGSASEAQVPSFIEFIAKDLPDHQLPLRGGLMWLDNEAIDRFEKTFLNLTPTEQIKIVDDIAYPDLANPEMLPGVRFFNRMRDLTLTGFYTTRMGINALGYKGNIANVWDGVPEEVLQKHGLAYEEEWLAKCIDQNTRAELPKWDAEGNLIA